MSAAARPTVLGPVSRPVGLETEYGIVEPGNPYANPMVLSSRIVQAYGAVSRPGLRAPAVAWDYEGEDPLADLRGGHLARSTAHPSQLTDDPLRPAPSGDGAGASPVPTDAAGTGAGGSAADLDDGRSRPAAGDSRAADPPPAPWAGRPRPTAAEAALPRATTAVLSNGARLYVDHAHPEYSSPEVLTPRDALVWDRAGEVVARGAMEALGRSAAHRGAEEVVLYKNNVDGKGATYGTHENYLVRRDLPFHLLATALIPFLVTRPVVVGAGRVGLGQSSERPGFQISQRADYVECAIGLQTTFNRPIVNTRDEPHADAERFRRLHIINGDANLFDVPIYLKVATTDLLLWYLERAHDRGEGLGALADLRLTHDPVEEHWNVSHDPGLRYRLATQSGPMTALAIQRAHLEAVRRAVAEDFGGTDAAHAGKPTAEALALWQEVLDALCAYAAAGTPRGTETASRAAAVVEWLAKLELCEALRARAGVGWDDPRLAALDIQWGDLRDGRGVADRFIAGGRARRLCTDHEVRAAAAYPPRGTRAAVRGEAVARFAEVVAASWTSLVLDVPGRPELLRLALPAEVAVDHARTVEMLDMIRDALGTHRGLGGH